MSATKAATPGEAVADQHSPAMLPFFVCCFLMDFAGGASMLAVPLLATQWGASPALLGYIGTAGGLGYVLMAALSGWLSDRLGRTPLPLVASLSVPVLSFLYPWLPGPAYMVPVAFLAGIALGFFWPPMESWIADVFEGRDLARALSGFNISWSLGGTIGILLSGYLFELAHWLPFAVILIAPLAVAILLRRLPRPPVQAHGTYTVEPCAGSPLAQADRSTSPGPSMTSLWLAWTLNFTIIFASAATRSLFPKLAQELHISSGTVGVIVFTMSLFKLIAFVLIRARGLMPQGLMLFVIPNVLLIGSMLGFLYSSSAAGFILSSAGAGIATGIGYSASLLMSLMGTAGRGTRSGVHEAILALGILAGPLLCGLVAEHSDLRAPYLVCAALTVVVLAGQTFICCRQHR